MATNDIFFFLLAALTLLTGNNDALRTMVRFLNLVFQVRKIKGKRTKKRKRALLGFRFEMETKQGLKIKIKIKRHKK